jgi:predicted nucleic acid-binding protein
VSIEKIYWDSCAYLGWLQEEADKVKLCKGTIERAEAGEVLIVTSALTIAEVLWLKGGPKLPKDKLTILRKFFRRSYMRVINVNRAIAESAQDVVWANSIKPKDAVHIATAISLKIPTLETFDEPLLSQSGKIGDPALIIRKPIPPRQDRLDL